MAVVYKPPCGGFDASTVKFYSLPAKETDIVASISLGSFSVYRSFCGGVADECTMVNAARSSDAIIRIMWLASENFDRPDEYLQSGLSQSF